MAIKETLVRDQKKTFLKKKVSLKKLCKEVFCFEKVSIF